MLLTYMERISVVGYSFSFFVFVFLDRKLAAQLVDPFQPGDFNQALMELGATVCTPTSPSCSSCPVSDQCRALSITRHDSSVSVTDYPVKGVKIKQRHDFSAACVLEILGDRDGHQMDGTFLLVKRPDEGLLAGLWEFPSVSLDGEVGVVKRREAIDQFLKNHFRIDPRNTCKIVSREHVGEFVHVFTHIRLKIYVELLVLQLKGLALLSLPPCVYVLYHFVHMHEKELLLQRA